MPGLPLRSLRSLRLGGFIFSVIAADAEVLGGGELTLVASFALFASWRFIF